MQVSKANDVRIYNLSAGKSLPEWLGDRQRRKLEQKNVEVRRRIQLIQDFEMPDVSHTVNVTPDGRYIYATGSYKPFIKCFDLKNLSQKFERGVDADVVKMHVLSDDFSKIVVLEEERYIEMHAAYGRYFRMRIPRPGRDMDFCRESADLYVVGSTPEIYRLNLQEGVFLEPLIADATTVNCCQFSPCHQLFVAGTSEGTVEAWDHRDRKRVGVLDAIPALRGEISGLTEVTSICWQDALHFGIGTSSGHILLFDVRSSRPLLVKDQNNALPIKRLNFVEREGAEPLVLSMDSRAVKMWQRETGKPVAAIEPQHGLNDFVRYPDSGLLLMACEAPRMLQFFVPALGMAPKWCAYLETITEELEESEQPAVYDDYKFVTADELEALGLSHLIGTNILRAYMHGYFIDIRLYAKARTLTQPFAYEKYKERKIREKVDEERERHVVKKREAEKQTPKVNAELAERLREEAENAATKTRRKRVKNKKKADSASNLLSDSRFSRLFESEDFQVDETSEAFARLARAADTTAKKKGKRPVEMEEASSEDEEEIEQVDLSELQLGDDGDERRKKRRSAENGESSDLEEETDDEGESEEEGRLKKLPKEDIKRKIEAKQRKRAARQAEVEAEKAARAASKPSRFVLKEAEETDSIQKMLQTGDDGGQMSHVPLSARRALEQEDGGGDVDVAETSANFGGKAMTFELKRKGPVAERKEREKAQADQHAKERKKERRTLGAVRKMMTPLPGNLVLDPSRGGRGGRGRGGRGARGRGGRGGAARL